MKPKQGRPVYLCYGESNYYYLEKRVINGVVTCRATPDGAWVTDYRACWAHDTLSGECRGEVRRIVDVDLDDHGTIDCCEAHLDEPDAAPG